MMAMKAYFLVVEDCSHLARALAAKVKGLLRWDAEVVVAQSAGTAVASLGKLGPWIGAIVDYRLPDGNGLQVLSGFRRMAPKAPGMLLTGYPIDAGLSSAAARQLSVAVGKDVFDQVVGAFVAQAELIDLESSGALGSVRKLIRASGLSRRQAEALRRALNGESQHAIAAALGLEVRTVESHIDRALEKLGANSVHELSTMLLKLALGGDWFPRLKESA